eukprot:UN07415
MSKHAQNFCLWVTIRKLFCYCVTIHKFFLPTGSHTQKFLCG